MHNNTTLIKLIKYVCLIALLLIIILFTFINSHNKVKYERYVYTLESIEEKVNVIRDDYVSWKEYDANLAGNFFSYLKSLNFKSANTMDSEDIEEFTRILEELSTMDLKYWNPNQDTVLANYFYFSKEDLKSIFNIDFDSDVIINFSTGNIVAKNPITDKKLKKKIYRSYDSAIGKPLTIYTENSDKIFTAIDILENNGLTCKVKVYLKSDITDRIPKIDAIYYYEDDNYENRKKANDLKDYAYDSFENAAYFTVSRSGNYSFIAIDFNHVQYKKVDYEFALCNKPVLIEGMQGVYFDSNGEEHKISSEVDPNWYNYNKNNFVMANSKDTDGNYWVWVPRFKYLKQTDKNSIVFLRESSDIATSSKIYDNYKIHDSFKDDSLGFWVAKYQVGKTSQGQYQIRSLLKLDVDNKNNARMICKTFLNGNSNIDMMTIEQCDAIKMLANYKDLSIEKDNVYYSGGTPKQESLIDNGKYSSSGNISGVFDIDTSVDEMKLNENILNGRYRPSISIK